MLVIPCLCLATVRDFIVEQGNTQKALSNITTIQKSITENNRGISGNSKNDEDISLIQDLVERIPSLPNYVADWEQAGHTNGKDNLPNATVEIDVTNTGLGYDLIPSDSIDDYDNFENLLSALYETSNNDTILLSFPPGVYDFRRRIMFDNLNNYKNVIIRGAGSNLTEFVFDLSDIDLYWTYNNV